MENVQNINIDIMNNKTYDYIYTKQYDVGREVVFHITQNGEAWGESGISVIFELMKPDGFCIIDTLEFDATNKTVTLVLDEQCTCTAGRLPYQLTFRKDGKLISTVTGKMQCEKAVVQNGEIKSTSSGNLIEDLVELYDNNIFEAKSVVLLASGWNSVTHEQTVEVPGIIPDESHQLVIVRPKNDSMIAYAEADIMCIEQGEGTLTFKCETVPNVDIDVFITSQGIDSRLGNIAFTYSSTEPGKYDQNEDDVWIVDYDEDPSGEQSVSNRYSAEFMSVSGGGDLPVYNTIQIDDVNGDIILINDTTWDGTNTSLKAAIMALQGGGGGGVTTVHLSPDEYAALTPEQKEDTSKIYFVDEEEEP